MLDVLLTGSVSFVITFLSIPVIIRIAEEKKLFDIPDGRKLHQNPIASLGGVGIFAGFFMAAMLSVSLNVNPEFQYYLAAALVIFSLGLKDDIVVLTPTKKFLGQLTAAAILIHLAGVRITSMHGLFGLGELPEVVSIGLSYLTIILVINSFNLIDGVDGLAGMLGLLTTSVFGTYFFLVGMPAYSIISFALGGSLLAFMIFNYNPAKIFMGDCGSLLLGLVNSILAIKFIAVADSSTVALPIASAVAVGISVLIVPLLDTIRVFSIRIVNGRSPFSPDRNHIHHLLLDRGLSHKYVTVFCFLLNIVFITIAYFGRHLGPTYLLSFMTALSLSFLGILIYAKKPVIFIPAKSKPLVANVRSVAQPSTKVVAIDTDVVPMGVAESN
jgi:UDP-N-acetylmuramyl pentapeptide phosphotransferase/UDP-N-acetylglucosamine-1-phosphate transferase